MHKVLHNIFTARARQQGDAIAVMMGEKTLTYQELDQRSTQWATRLRAIGVRPETTVALYLDRSLEMVTAILAVLKAGGCYVPIDLAYPKERASFMLADSAAKLLLTQSALAERLPATDATIIFLDTDWADNTQSPDDGASEVTGENAAYIIYTSGSTGKPKGVAVTHHNVIRLLEQTAHWYQFNERDIWPLFHSYAFDVSVWELWASLLHGGQLVIVPYLVSRSPSEFYELIAKEKVTVLNQTPSAFRQFIWAESQEKEPRDLSLRYVICAGEALELQSLKPWFDRHGDERPLVVNMYGITETTVHSTYRPIRRRDLTSGVGSVIGVPIPDLQIHLLDETLQPVKPGAVGEIFVGGDGVARGYVNRDALTHQRFLPDPFSPKPGARMYRSGDLAKIGASGEMEYLGRCDHQVKIRGFRVELGEIESALNRDPSVRESCVIARVNSDGQNRLTAYVVPKDVAPNVTLLRERLAQAMPAYMIPAHFVVMVALPLNTNGKVDRAALPTPETARPTLESSYVAPRNETEKTLAQIWEQTLGVSQAGIRDNFFELGGDSIRAITILSKARELGLDLSVQQMFERPTIEELATCASSVEEQTSTIAAFFLLSAEDRAQMPEDVEDAYPITRLQLGMFFHNELNPKSAVYHDVFSFRIEAPFDREKLEAALRRLISRHAILRTSFHIAGFSEPLQLVRRHAAFHLTVEDLRSLSLEEKEEALVKWVEKEKRRPFERTSPPLARFHAQWREDNVFQFILSFHHACLDGWSLAAVVTEIFQDYAAQLAGQNAVIATPRANYRDYIKLERETIASPDEARFWKENLAGSEFRSLARWPVALRAGGEEQVRGPEVYVDKTILCGLKELARQAGTPLKSVLLAAHQRVISFLYGQSDVTSGLLCNGRPEEVDGEKTVGLFLNTIPLRLKLEPGSWLNLVRQTFAAELKIAPHRRMPLAEIQKAHDGRKLFETAFDFVHFHVYNNLQAGGLDLREGRYFEANDLTAFTSFLLSASGAVLEFHIDYNPNELCRAQTEEMSDCYNRTLRAMAQDANASHDAFSPMSAAERNRLLVDWNQTEEEYPQNAGIHELFERQAAETPLATALVFKNEALTYRELNRRAREIAQTLRNQGAGTNTLVGICLERGPAMVAAVLGTLATGAAYVPLDPTFPAERLAHMVEDAQPRAILFETKTRAKLPRTKAALICVDSLPQPGESRAVAGVARSDDLAYVIYTSGSTGKPKGVEVTHRAVVNLLTSAGRKLNFTPKDKLLAVTTLSFDIAGLELFLPLISGATLVLAPQESLSDGSKLAALVASSDATVMQGTPATWRLLIDSGWMGKKDLRILCGGESLPRTLADELLSRASEVWNFYGPTETTIWSTAWKVAASRAISIGRPLANTQIYILDATGQPTPTGVPGELHIGGAGVARGYHNRPELTGEKFIPNPFAGAGSGRLYKTGDLARYQIDGNVEWLGRTDQQLKIRGFRIELGDLENALRQHPAIAQAVAAAHEDGCGEKRLTAYFSGKDETPSHGELREFLRQKLPAYMIPSRFVLLERFPLTPNGKIDRRALPAPGEVTRNPETFTAPSNETEKALAEIWQETLAIRQIGVHEDFFELGADSLSATRAFARIKRRFEVEVPLRAIFEHPTISSLAQVIGESERAATNRPDITRRRRRLIKVTA